MPGLNDDFLTLGLSGPPNESKASESEASASDVPSDEPIDSAMVCIRHGDSEYGPYRLDQVKARKRQTHKGRSSKLARSLALDASWDARSAPVRFTTLS